MAIVKLYKVVASLPQTLEPDTIYAVRSGQGFDLYITDQTGSIAYQVNSADPNPSAYSPLDHNYIKNVYDKKLGVIIPYYEYPYDTNTWNDWSANTKRLISTLRNFQSPAIVIVNPSNGAGTQEDVVYRRFIKMVLGANALPAGYIPYGYGNRNLQDVLTDIDRWKQIYPLVNALFIDEVPYEVNVSQINYIISYARAKGFRFIIGNPGSPLPENITLQLQFDNLMIYETATYTVNETFEGNWEDSYREQTKMKFSGIVYGVSSGIDYHKFYNFQKYFKYVYICNSYTSLPSYFEEFIKYIDSLNRFRVNFMTNPVSTAYSWLPNSTGSTALTTLTLTANRIYYMPFISETEQTLSKLAIFVSTAATGTGEVGIYSSINMRPTDLIWKFSINTGTTGLKQGTTTLTLSPNTVYFLALNNSSAAKLRAIPVADCLPILGVSNTETAYNTHLYAKGSNGTLPTSAGTTFTVGTGAVPSIFVN